MKFKAGLDRLVGRMDEYSSRLGQRLKKYRSESNFSDYGDNTKRAIYMALTALAATCSNGTEPSKPTGNPSASISANPESGRGVLNPVVTANAQAGENATLREVWVDWNSNNTRESEEIAAPSSNTWTGSRTPNYDNRMTGPQTYPIKIEVLQSDGKPASALVNIRVAPSNAPTLSAPQIPSQTVGNLQVNGQIVSTPDLERIINDISRVFDINGQKDSSMVVNSSGAPGQFSMSVQWNYQNLSATTQNGTLKIVTTDRDGRTATITTPFSVLPYFKADGTITDLLTGQPIQEARVIAAGDTATAGADGIYAILKGTKQLDTILVSANGYQTRLTFLPYSSVQGRGNFSLISNGADPLIPGNTIIQSVNQIARSTGEQVPRDTSITRWDETVKPRYIINETGYRPETVSYIIDVLKNDIETLTNGHVKNATDSDIIRVTSSPTDLNGMILFELGTTGVWEYLRSSDFHLYRGARIKLGDGVTRSTVDHELAHVLGHTGHYNSVVGSIMDAIHSGPGPSAIDARNARVIWDRPAGSAKPDNDPRPAAGASSAAYNNSNSIRRYNSRTQIQTTRRH